MKHTLLLSLALIGLVAFTYAQTTQPTASVEPKAELRVQPAKETLVTVQPPALTTIDINADWLGLTNGGKVRILVSKIYVIRPHVAGTGTLQVTGSAIDLPWGVYYTRESVQSLSARLAAKGWGDSTPLPFP